MAAGKNAHRKLTSCTRRRRGVQEPDPRVVGDWENVIGRQTLNKFIFMAEPRRIDEIRPHVQETLQGRAVLTQAQSNMLEVLPLGVVQGRRGAAATAEYGHPNE